MTRSKAPVKNKPVPKKAKPRSKKAVKAVKVVKPEPKVRAKLSAAPVPQAKPSAFSRALQMIDDMLEKPEMQKLLREAFDTAFRDDPVIFYKQFIHPIAAKGVGSKDLDGEQRIRALILDGATGEELED